MSARPLQAYYSGPQQSTTSPAYPSQSPLLLDSGASHRVTNDARYLSVSLDYDGTDEIVEGDGNSPPITHIIGSAYMIYAKNESLLLSNFLFVPNMKK